MLYLTLLSIPFAAADGGPDTVPSEDAVSAVTTIDSSSASEHVDPARSLENTQSAVDGELSLASFREMKKEGRSIYSEPVYWYSGTYVEDDSLPRWRWIKRGATRQVVLSGDDVMQAADFALAIGDSDRARELEQAQLKSKTLSVAQWTTLGLQYAILNSNPIGSIGFGTISLASFLGNAFGPMRTIHRAYSLDEANTAIAEYNESLRAAADASVPSETSDR